MNERTTKYKGHQLTILIPETSDETHYLKNQNMDVIIGEQGVSIGEMITANEFHSRSKSWRIPIVLVTSAGHEVYDTVNSVDNL